MATKYQNFYLYMMCACALNKDFVLFLTNFQSLKFNNKASFPTHPLFYTLKYIQWTIELQKQSSLKFLACCHFLKYFLTIYESARMDWVWLIATNSVPVKLL